jgi:hypothetical protein
MSKNIHSQKSSKRKGKMMRTSWRNAAMGLLYQFDPLLMYAVQIRIHTSLIA